MKALCTLWSLDLLEATYRHLSARGAVTGEWNLASFEGLGGAVGGPIMATSVRVCLVVSLYFAQVVFIVLLGDLVAPVVAYAAPGAFLARRWVCMAFGCLLVYPMALLDNLTSLQHASLGGLLCLGYLVVALLAVAGQRIATGARSDFQWVAWPPTRAALYVPSLQGLAFCCQFNMPPLMGEMRHPSKAAVRAVKWMSVAIALSLYMAVAFVGYVTFGSDTNGDILRQNFDIRDRAITVGRIGLAFTLVLKYPLILQPMRSTLNGLLGIDGTVGDGEEGAYARLDGDAEAPQSGDTEQLHGSGEQGSGRTKKEKVVSLFVALETAFIMGTALFVSAVIPNVQQVFSLAGALSGGVVCFNLPAYYALAAPLPGAWDRTKAWVINVFGVVVTIVSLVVSVMDLA